MMVLEHLFDRWSQRWRSFMPQCIDPKRIRLRFGTHSTVSPLFRIHRFVRWKHVGILFG